MYIFPAWFPFPLLHHVVVRSGKGLAGGRTMLFGISSHQNPEPSEPLFLYKEPGLSYFAIATQSSLGPSLSTFLVLIA